MTGTATLERPKARFINVFHPLPWQVAPWRDTSPVLVLTGSAGGGKSKLAAEKLHGYCLRYPGSTALAIRKTRDSMINSTVLFMDRKVIGDDPRVKHWLSKRRWEYANGSILAYGGMADDEQREQIRSIGQDGSVDIAWLEEATSFTENDFNELGARMRGKAAPWQQIMLTTNPDRPTHWVNKRLIEGGQGKCYYSSARDNPHNPPAYLHWLEQLTGVLGLRLRDGKWVQAEGAVYEAWDPSIHVIDRFEIPSDWRRIRVVDFGFVNPFVCQWWALDNEDRMYLYREIYMTRRTVRVHAEAIRRHSQDEYFEANVCDHDAEDRATLEENDIRPTMAAVKDVSPGIQAVQERLKLGADGKPRLFIMRGALVEMDPALEDTKKPHCTEAEFPGYVWPKSADGKPIKEVPVKENDHGMDATRYAVMYVDKGPSLPFSWLTLPEAR